MPRCSFSPIPCLPSLRLPFSKQVFGSAPRCLGALSTVQPRQGLTLSARKIRNAGGSVTRLRLTGRKIQNGHGIRERIQMGVQWHKKGISRSPRRIRGVSRVRYIFKKGDLHHSPRRVPERFIGKQPVRTKYVWLGDWAQRSGPFVGKKFQSLSDNGSFQFDSTWTRRYHRLVEKGESVNLHMSLQYPNVERLVRRYASLNMSVRSTHMAWMHIPLQHRLRVWQDIMLWCLHHNATRALKLLLASMKGRQFRPPRHVVGDCLQHLAKTFLHKVTNPDPWALNAIYHLVHKYVEGGSEGHRIQHVPDQVVFLMLVHCDDEKVMKLLNTFTLENVQVHANTLLHALSRSLDMGDVNASLRLLRLVVRSGLGRHRDQVYSACVRLVRTQFDVAEPFTLQTKILTQILEMGIRPNIALYNAVLLNTVEAGYYDLALQMFKIAKENDLAPDGITYKIILGGSMEHADRSSRRKLVREMERDAQQFRDPRMVSELLRAMSKSYEPAFPRMLEFYKQYYDPRPLEELGFYDRKIPLDDTVPAKDKWPSPKILGQMICAYIGNHRRSKILLDIYNRFHDLVLQNHPIINPVSRTDHVANAFIMAFGRHVETLPYCTKVIKHMLDDSSSRRLSIQPDESFPKSAAPTVRTWSILAAAYFKHKQMIAAEKVLELMRERGLEPDQVTWNTVISGYSSMQQLEKAIDTMRRMEASGYTANSRTLKALRKIWNRDRLLDALSRNLGEGKAENDRYRENVERQRKAAREEAEEMAMDWETDDAIPGLEVTKYLRERYQNLAAEHKRMGASG